MGAPGAAGLHTAALERVPWTLLLWAGAWAPVGGLMQRGGGLERSVTKPPPRPRPGGLPMCETPGTLVQPLRKMKAFV